MSAATTRLDALRADAERELIEHVRSRHDLEALIERLIGRLDEADAPDEDREDFDEDCDLLIERGEDDTSDDEPSLGASEVTTASGVASTIGRYRLNGLDQSLWGFGVGDDREEDPAESGIADHDALIAEDCDFGLVGRTGFDGSGRAIAERMLAPVWRAKASDPDEVTIIRDGLAIRFHRAALVRVGGAWMPRT